MHGDFFYWEYALEAVRLADHPRVGIVHNCDPREMKFGPISCFYDPVVHYIRHVHMHDLENPRYPYKELFTLLKEANYSGFCSLEEGYREGGERKVIALYAALYRELVAQS